MNYTIKNSEITATFSSLGAELISLQKAGREYIWQNGTGEWAGHAPLLFPVCGHFGVKVDGLSYPIPFHGVARKAEFSVKEQSGSCITFELTSNEETQKLFPFAFVFRVKYSVDGDTLTLVYEVENPADKTLYFSCGSHEAYALDKEIQEYEVEFEKEENFINYRTTPNGYLSGETADLGTKKVLPLPLEFLQNNDSIILKNINSRKVTLREIGGKTLAEITFEGFSNLLFWRAMDGKFICIEPWTNVPDSAGVEDIEFSQKEGVMAVSPRDVKTLTRTVKVF